MGGQHHSSTIKNGSITEAGQKLVVGFKVKETSMTIAVTKISAKASGMFFEKLGKISSKICKELATSLGKNPGRALEIRAKTGSAAVLKNPKGTFFTITDVRNFYHTGKDCIFEKLCRFKCKNNFLNL